MNNRKTLIVARIKAAAVQNRILDRLSAQVSQDIQPVGQEYQLLVTARPQIVSP